MVYLGSGSMKCFECDDEGQNRSSCPHKEPAAEGEADSGALQSLQVAAADIITGDPQPVVPTNHVNKGNNSKTNDRDGDETEAQPVLLLYFCMLPCI